MKYKDFEDFIEEKHAEQYIGLDDDMPDDCNEWIANLDADEWLEYGQAYAKIMKRKAYNEIVEWLESKKALEPDTPFNRLTTDLFDAMAVAIADKFLNK